MGRGFVGANCGAQKESEWQPLDTTTAVGVWAVKGVEDGVDTRQLCRSGQTAGRTRQIALRLGTVTCFERPDGGSLCNLTCPRLDPIYLLTHPHVHIPVQIHDDTVTYTYKFTFTSVHLLLCLSACKRFPQLPSEPITISVWFDYNIVMLIVSLTFEFHIDVT